MYDLLAADIGRHGIPVQIKAINGGARQFNAESLSPFWGGSGVPNQTAFIITDLPERPSDLSQYRLIGRRRAFLYLIRNSFFVPQVEQAF
jgi:hypothetical protein